MYCNIEMTDDGKVVTFVKVKNINKQQILNHYFLIISHQFSCKRINLVLVSRIHTFDDNEDNKTTKQNTYYYCFLKILQYIFGIQSN